MNPAKRAVRFFNTTGPCNPDDHYMLPPAERLVGAQLDRYIRDKLYWVLHAPRQTGKTTFLQSWMREINSGKEALACYVSVEDCQGITERAEAMRTIYRAICTFAKFSGFPIPELDTKETEGLLQSTLAKWSELTFPRPLIVLFDEVDVLTGDGLTSFLRQLRGGFAERGAGKFPVSIALVGMRDLKDYITVAKGGVSPNPGSPFNIKEDSAVIANFQRQDVAMLFAQRTKETGQGITEDALDYIWEQSRGQPWIVNSLLKRATMRVLNEKSRETVIIRHIQEAREQMIQARETHLDALGVRLRDPGIKQVIQVIITGDSATPLGRNNPNVELAMDLGLISWSSMEGFKIANPVYEEIFLRCLNSEYHDSLPPPSAWRWQKPDGNLDMDALLKEFQGFWRKHSDLWEQKADYTEAFPHLLLTAFLQRILNGGGHIEREYAAGRGRMDLAVEYNNRWYIIEIKLLREYNTPEEVKTEGMEQITKYRDKIDGKAPAYLAIFDRRPKAKQKPWEERLGWEAEGGVTVVRC
jgi:hypothetical protein